MPRSRFASAACTVAILCASSTLAAGYPPSVGQPHPDFTLPCIEDRAPVTIKE